MLNNHRNDCRYFHKKLALEQHLMCMWALDLKSYIPYVGITTYCHNQQWIQGPSNHTKSPTSSTHGLDGRFAPPINLLNQHLTCHCNVNMHGLDPLEWDQTRHHSRSIVSCPWPCKSTSKLKASPNAKLHSILTKSSTCEVLYEGRICVDSKKCGLQASKKAIEKLWWRVAMMLVFIAPFWEWLCLAWRMNIGY